ncbi:MAG: hypothetical protein AAF573_17585 [Bacteroidota bacterium]
MQTDTTKDDNKLDFQDEITLEYLVIKFKEFYRELIDSWKLITLIVAPFCIYFLYQAISEDVTYTAKLSFMLSEDGKSGMGGLGGIASALGFGSAASGEYNLEKILSLSKSRHIIQQVLFEEVKIKKNEDYVANHIIQLYDYHDEWEDDTTGMKDFLFEHRNFPTFTRRENKVLKLLYTKVKGNREKDIVGLLKSEIDEDTGIMRLKINSVSEQLSLVFANQLYAKLSSYYIDKTVGKQNNTYQIMKSKVDSIRAELDVTQYQYLKYFDTNRNTKLRVNENQRYQLQRKLEALNIAYQESLKNVEVADFALRSNTPFIDIIDAPIPPLIPQYESKVRALLIGGFLGGFLAVAFVIGRKIIMDTLAAIESKEQMAA